MSRLRVHGSLIVYTVYVPCVYTVLRTRHPRFLNTRLNILTHVEYHDLYWILRARHQRESNTRKRERERARAREILFFIVGIWKSWNYSTRTLTSSTRRGNNFVSLFPVRMWATSSVYSSRKCLDEISIWIVRRPNYGLTFSFVVFFSHRARFNLPPSFFFFFFYKSVYGNKTLATCIEESLHTVLFITGGRTSSMLLCICISVIDQRRGWINPESVWKMTRGLTDICFIGRPFHRRIQALS